MKNIFLFYCVNVYSWATAFTRIAEMLMHADKTKEEKKEKIKT